MKLLAGEKLIFTNPRNTAQRRPSDEMINQKYVKGDVRIVTEQARYPLTGIVSMVNSDNYELNPEFQRRHRWNKEKQSRLIESFIMNVPIPPIFLYEDRYSHYEVMDGLQRLTAIFSFYNNELALEGLEEWPELNGFTYKDLPEQVRRGVDRRYLSSIILLQETAKDQSEAQRLKQLVFERINSGGVRLEPQEARNAIYNGPLNQLCIKLARNKYLCKTWGIPEPTTDEIKNDITPQDLLENAIYRKMKDVELVLRFFAYRQRLSHPEGNLEDYLNMYLDYGNSFPQDVLDNLEALFNDTIQLVFEIFGAKAFQLWRQRENSNQKITGKWGWFDRANITVYEPMTYVLSQYIGESEKILKHKDEFKERIKKFYEDNYEAFGGRNTTNLSKIEERNRLFHSFVRKIIG